ncbi:MAG: hypothetical protein Q8920_04390 [Bacillota bacterium]|nr:hypothetical protein [Bacillota bacterium]
MADITQIIGLTIIFLAVGNSIRLLLRASKRISRTKNAADISGLFKLQVICNWVIAGIVALAIW